MSGAPESYKKLVQAAKEAAEKTYSPYSHYPVGAALLTEDGHVITGCNVENVSFGGTICAERTAYVKAVSQGYRRFQAVAVVCKKAHDCWPCGICRQFMCEFGVDVDVVVEAADGTVHSLKLADLLPRHFGAQTLPR